METIILAILIVAVYFMPMLIAWNRGHRNQNPIAIINLFFGWTVVGWVGCLAWALSSNVEPPAAAAPGEEIY